MSEKVSFFPKYLIWLIIIGVSVFAFLQLINYLHNSDKDNISTTVKTPYVLSISPISVDERSKITISFNTLNVGLINPSLSLYVIYPDSEYTKIPNPIKGDHQFPLTSNNMAKGNYRVTLTDTSNNTEILSSNFTVRSYSWYNQLYDLFYVGNITSLIPLLIPAIAFIYNVAARQSEERQKSLEEYISNLITRYYASNWQF